MIIQHNMMAQNAMTKYGIATNALAKSTEKLSSGYRINRAADDAAGLSISEKMRNMIRGLNQASSNAQDGISLLQTAEGALNEVHSILSRMRELSVQAANDTNATEDRQAIQQEIDQLSQEINRIADDTEFNKLKLLDGSLEGSSPNINADGISTFSMMEDGMEIALPNLVVDGVVAAGITNLSSTQIDKATDIIKNELLPKAVNTLVGKLGVLSTAYASGKLSNEIGFEIYQDTSSVMASVGIGYSYNAAKEVVGVSLGLRVNTKYLEFNAAGTDLTASSKELLSETIIHEMTHAVMDDILTNGMIGAKNGVLDSNEKFVGWFREGMAQTTAGGFNCMSFWQQTGIHLLCAFSRT